MGTTESTATNLLPKGTATSAGSPPSGPGSNGPDYGDSSFASGSSYTSPSYTPPDAAIWHMPFLNPSSSEPAFPSTPTPSPNQDPEIYTPWRAPENSAKPLGKAEIGTNPALPLVETDPDRVARTSRDQIQAWKSRVEAQTQQQAKAAAPAPIPKPMSVTPKRPSPLSAEARASNGRLAEAMARASDPTQILPILKDAQDIDPVQFKAEFQDISDQLWQNLPAHRREAAHQDFMTQAKKALGWDQRPSQDTRPSQATPNPHPDAKDSTQRIGQVTQQPASAEAQPTAATTPAQQATPGTPQGAASQDQTTDPSQPPASNPQPDSAPKSYEVQRNPHTGDAYLYDAKTRDLVRTADGTPATIGDVNAIITPETISDFRQRDVLLSEVKKHLTGHSNIMNTEELRTRIKEAFPYAAGLQKILIRSLTSSNNSGGLEIPKQIEDVASTIQDPSFHARYSEFETAARKLDQDYPGGFRKYNNERGVLAEKANKTLSRVISEAQTLTELHAARKTSLQDPSISAGAVDEEIAVSEEILEILSQNLDAENKALLLYPKLPNAELDEVLGFGIARAETAQQRHLDNKTNLALSILGVVPPLRAASTLNTIESNVAPTMLDRAKALVGFVSGPGAEAASVVKGLDTAEKNVMQSMIRKHGLSTKDVIGIQNYMKKNTTFVDELATKTRNAQNAVLVGALSGFASGKVAEKLGINEVGQNIIKDKINENVRKQVEKGQNDTY